MENEAPIISFIEEKPLYKSVFSCITKDSLISILCQYNEILQSHHNYVNAFAAYFLNDFINDLLNFTKYSFRGMRKTYDIIIDLFRSLASDLTV